MAVAVAAVIALSVVAFHLAGNQTFTRERCIVEVGNVRTSVDLEQAQWVALFAAIAERRNLPPRATTIAIATAFQESKIHNIDYGDRDSVGLFQQRPSQGWGTVEEIMDPVYSTNAFYDGLVQIADYEQLEITVAAQAVQRSAFPDAYAQHEPRSRALASALRGHSQASMWCELNPRESGTAEAVNELLGRAYGPVTTETSEDGRLLTIPVGGDEVLGWSYAHFLASNAAALGLESIAFDQLEWSISDAGAGWVATDSADTAQVRVQLNY